MNGLDEMIESAVMGAELMSGVHPDLVRVRGNGKFLAPVAAMSRNPSWSDEEIAYLRERMGIDAVDVISEKLGRSETAIKVMAKRLRLVSPSNHPMFLTVKRFSRLIGRDDHIGMRIVNEYLDYDQATALKLRKLVLAADFWEWLKKPESWVWVRMQRADKRVREFILAEQKKFGDRYLTTAQAADVYNRLHPEQIAVTLNDIYVHAVEKGKCKVLRLYNQNNRHPNAKWCFVYVLESDVKKLTIKKLGKRKAK